MVLNRKILPSLGLSLRNWGCDLVVVGSGNSFSFHALKPCCRNLISSREALNFGGVKDFFFCFGFKIDLGAGANFFEKSMWVRNSDGSWKLTHPVLGRVSLEVLEVGEILVVTWGGEPEGGTPGGGGATWAKTTPFHKRITSGKTTLSWRDTNIKTSNLSARSNLFVKIQLTIGNYYKLWVILWNGLLPNRIKKIINLIIFIILRTKTPNTAARGRRRCRWVRQRRSGLFQGWII